MVRQDTVYLSMTRQMKVLAYQPVLLLMMDHSQEGEPWDWLPAFLAPAFDSSISPMVAVTKMEVELELELFNAFFSFPQFVKYNFLKLT